MCETHHIPKSVKYPNKNDNGICNSWISLNSFLNITICPNIKAQFHIISHVPSDNEINLQLITFATEEIGETPNSPLLVIATPKAEKNKR